MTLSANAIRRLQLTLLALVLSCAIARAGEPNLGTLPVGAISTSVTSGVTAEICRDHLFDAASTHLKLPANYRIRPAGEIASSDPAVAELIRLNPTMRTHA